MAGEYGANSSVFDALDSHRETENRPAAPPAVFPPPARLPIDIYDSY